MHWIWRQLKFKYNFLWQLTFILCFKDNNDINNEKLIWTYVVFEDKWVLFAWNNSVPRLYCIQEVIEGLRSRRCDHIDLSKIRQSFVILPPQYGFSFECRKVIWFCITTPNECHFFILLKVKLTQNSRDSLAHVFRPPSQPQAFLIFFEHWRVWVV